MKPLALDLSLTATGWATSLDEHGVATTPSKLRGVERLAAWKQRLIDMVIDDFGDVIVDLAALEGYAFGRPNQMAAIAEWGGVARLTLYETGISFVVVPPATLKKFATGRGNAKKPDMRMELYKRTQLDLEDDNEVDALWLLAAAHQAYDEPLWKMPAVNVDALSKVDWLLRESA